MAAEQQVGSKREPAPNMVRNFLRGLVNVWIVLHFVAIFSAAATAGPSSELLESLWKVFQPYLQVLYLNHGYGFFAPEPAPSMMLEYEAVLPDGSVKSGRNPPIEGIQPRLLYQRNLLLTEHLHLAPADRHDEWYRSYARHLCHALGARRVRLTTLVHSPPSPTMVRSGYEDDDPILYERFYLGEFPCED